MGAYKVSHSFLLPDSVLHVDVHFFPPFPLVDMRLFLLFGCYRRWCYEDSRTGLCMDVCFHSSWEIAKSGIGGSYAQIMFTFLKNLPKSLPK